VFFSFCGSVASGVASKESDCLFETITYVRLNLIPTALLSADLSSVFLLLRQRRAWCHEQKKYEQAFTPSRHRRYRKQEHNKYDQFDAELELLPESAYEKADTKATRREAAAAVAQEALSLADEARRKRTKLENECDNMAKCLHAVTKNASQATEEADKLRGEYDKLKGVYGNMVKFLNAFKKSRCPIHERNHACKARSR
jgi:hypothetical protein